MALLRRRDHHIKVTSLLSSFSVFRFIATQPHEPSNLSDEMGQTHFTDLVRDRCQSGTLGLNEAMGMFDQLIETKPIPSILHFNRIFRAIYSTKHYSTVLSLFKIMACVDVKPNTQTFIVLVNCYYLLGRVDFGFGVLGNIFKSGLEPNFVVLKSLLRGVLEDDKVEEGIEFLKKIVDNGYPCGLVAYGMVMDKLCRSGNVAAGLRVIEEMGKRGLKPNQFICSNMINSLCKKNRLNDAWYIFQGMIRTHDSSIQAPCDSGMSENGRSFLGDLVYSGISPNVKTFCILVDAFCRKRMVKKAHQLLYLMIQRGEQPDTWIYDRLMYGYCSEGRIAEALKVLCSIVDSGNKPSIISYNILINGCCKTNQVDEAKQLLVDSLCHKGLQPDNSTYSTLIGALCKVGKVSAAQDIIKMLQTTGENPNIFTYGILIDGLCANGLLSDAIELYHTMENNGLKANVVIYNTIISEMCKAGKLNEAREMICSLPGRGLQPDTKLYTAMINAFCKGGMVNDAQDLFVEMEKNSCISDEVTFNVLVQGFCQANDPKSAGKILNLMAERGFSPNKPTKCMIAKFLVADELDPVFTNKLLNFYFAQKEGGVLRV